MLDVVRAGATLLVTMNHLRVNQFPPYAETACDLPGVKSVFFFITRLGIEAVLLFFVLSGYLVGGGAARRVVQGRFDVASYGIDRFTRIYVPLIPAVVCALCAGAWNSTSTSTYEALINVLSLQGVLAPPLSANSALWSLSYEVWFYILCGAAAVLCSSRASVAFLTSWCVVFIALAVFTQLEAAYLFVWIMGACAFVAPPSKGALHLALGTVLVIAGTCLTQLTSVSRQVDLSGFSNIPRNAALLTLGFGYAIVLTSVAGIVPARPLGRACVRAGAAIAPWSYSLYLIHIPMIVAMRLMGILRLETELSAGAVFRFVCNLGLLCAGAIVFWRIFEANTRYVRQRLRIWLCISK